MLGYVLVFERESLSDCEEGFQWLREAAKQGSRRAQATLGAAYDSRVRKVLESPSWEDPVEAATWYMKAAQRGDSYACGRLGELYVEGRGVSQNRAEGERWLRLAARRGRVEAQYTLAERIEARKLNGEGISGAALHWFKKAALGGSRMAQLALGERYATKGPDHDPAKAHMWLALARRAAACEGEKANGGVESVPGLSSEQLTPAQTLRAEKQANKLYRHIHLWKPLFYATAHLFFWILLLSESLTFLWISLRQGVSVYNVSVFLFMVIPYYALLIYGTREMYVGNIRFVNVLLVVFVIVFSVRVYFFYPLYFEIGVFEMLRVNTDLLVLILVVVYGQWLQLKPRLL